jgi:hypothetical protein
MKDAMLQVNRPEILEHKRTEKQQKKTGITTSLIPVAEARKRTLCKQNSRTSFQSVPEGIVQLQAESESSLSVNARSLPRENACLGSLARWGSALVRRGSRVRIPPEAPIPPFLLLFYAGFSAKVRLENLYMHY